MEELRFKQAENLIKKACRNINRDGILKQPTEGVINTRNFEIALKELIEAEDYIYLSLPFHRIGEEDAAEFCRKLISAKTSIEDILADFNVIEREDPAARVKDLSRSKLIIVNNTGVKKLLLKIGVSTQNILVAGAPLDIDDMLKINPSIPENALKGVEKKIEHLKNDIERKLEDLEEVVVIGEPDMSTELLARRARDLYGAEVRLRKDIKDLSPHEIIELLS